MSLILARYSLKRPVSVVALILLILAVVVGGVWYSQPALTEFEKLEDFRRFALEHGLHFHSGAGNSEKYFDSFYVADRPLNIEDITPLRHSQCGQTPAWRGILWVAARDSEHSPHHFLYLESIGGHYHLWGNLVVAGDPELLDRVEQLCRQR
jgi:hypothetical protein